MVSEDVFNSSCSTVVRNYLSLNIQAVGFLELCVNLDDRGHHSCGSLPECVCSAIFHLTNTTPLKHNNIPHYVGTDCMMRSTCLRFVSYTNIITKYVFYVAGLFIAAQYLQDTDRQTKPIAIMVLGRCVRCCSELFIELY